MTTAMCSKPGFVKNFFFSGCETAWRKCTGNKKYWKRGFIRWRRIEINKEFWVLGRKLHSHFFLGCALCFVRVFRTPTPSWNLGCGGISGVSGRRSWAHGCFWIAGPPRRAGRRGGESTGPYGFLGQRVQEHRRVGGCLPPPSLPLHAACVFLAHVSVLSLRLSKKPKYVQLVDTVFQAVHFLERKLFSNVFSFGGKFLILLAGTSHIVFLEKSLRRCRDMKPR